jgi:hypothetical protein
MEDVGVFIGKGVYVDEGGKTAVGVLVWVGSGVLVEVNVGEIWVAVGVGES